jgi:NAD(P)-dependent dehydrogenase (short-subunit alcohol dehydrogenase family)
VTGGASGIGLAIVRRLAAGGASVTARSPVRRLGVPEDIAAAAFLIVPLSGIVSRPVSPNY